MTLFDVKQKLFFAIIALSVVGYSIKLIPFESLKSNENAGQTHECPYYFTLQGILASYPLVAADKANLGFIKRKLEKFEYTMAHSTRTDILTYQTAKNSYFHSLAKFGLKSIANTRNENVILAIAQSNATAIDNYYLDTKNYCLSPLYDWYGAVWFRRILRFNLAGLYDHLPNKFDRILPAVPDDWLTGSTPGFFMVNQTTTFDSRFQSALPLVTALYLLPHYDFNSVGNYASPANWNYFRPHDFTDPATRKLLNIAGVDVFTVYKDRIEKADFADVELLPNKLNDNFSFYKYESFINKDSYGTAYLANHITIEDPKVIENYESQIKHYFAKHDDPAAFTNITNKLYQKLMTLKEKHDILLETDSPLLPGLNAGISNNSGDVQIKGMVGGRNLFTANCPNQNCEFVYNLSKTNGWQAYVNGVPATIERANLAFMAITIPEGKSTVWFVYSPLSWTITYFITILSLLGVMLASCGRSIV